MWLPTGGCRRPRCHSTGLKDQAPSNILDTDALPLLTILRTRRLPRSPRPTDRLHLMLQILLGAAIAFSFYMYALGEKDWELLASKHYWGRGFLYGGYANHIIELKNGYRTVHSEGLYGNVTNLVPLSFPERFSESSPRFTGFPGTERLLVPFMTYLVLRLTFGFMDVFTAFWIVNVTMWLLAVLMAYKLAAYFFGDEYSPLITAFITTMYPIFTLALHGVKVQAIGTVYLLAGIYLFEVYIRPRVIWLQAVYLTALLVLGMFASGGWAMLCVFIAVRTLWLRGKEPWLIVVVLVLSTAAARIFMNYLIASYKLPSVEEYLRFSYATMLSESFVWLNAWWDGQDVSQLRFLNLTGQTFFQSFIPTVWFAFLSGHFWVIVASAVSFIVCPRARMFVLLAIPLFVTGHMATLMTGWSQWHYGYLSAPAALMLFLALGGCFGQLLAVRRWPLRAAALIALVLIVSGYTDRKRHAGLYWGGRPDTYDDRVIVYMEGRPGAFVY
jgi:hypothetical protein